MKPSPSLKEALTALRDASLSVPEGEGGPAKTRVNYPFRSFDGGSVVDRQVTGQRI